MRRAASEEGGYPVTAELELIDWLTDWPEEHLAEHPRRRSV